ncbi:MAG: IclR family transcriptional regulator [Acidimicrobiia bacterium]|nr:IclR family transcriptional regulator [Acidimicrobiia bacterium]
MGYPHQGCHLSPQALAVVAPVSAVERAIQILLAFERHDEYSLTELVTLLGLNKSTAHGILQTLADNRFLRRDAETLRFRLGPALIRLGHLAHEQIDVRRVARPYMSALVQETRKSVLLGTFDAGRITFIDKVDPVGTLHVSAAIGQQVPFSVGSFGRVFLAWLPEGDVDQLIADHGLEAVTPASLTDPAEYKAELAKVREVGYAVDDTEEFLLGVRAVSVPLMGPDGVVAGLTVVGFTSRVGDQPGEPAIKAAVSAAHEISKQLGADMVDLDESQEGINLRQPAGALRSG